MKIKISIIIFCLMLTLFLAVSGCKKSDENDFAVMISRRGNTDSHKEGQNCMECHRAGGSGDGMFTLAGTVYNSSQSAVNPDGSVQLYSGPNATGTLVKSMEVDGKGNFYTTEPIDWGSGLYAVVSGTSESSRLMIMASPFTNGACNSCHGVSTARIWVE